MTTPLVFLHCAGATGALWAPQRGAFPGAEFPTLPGRLGADWGADTAPATIEAFATTLLAWLDTQEFERSTLVGTSMGGAIALQTALMAPERVAGLVLVGSGARLRVAPTIFAQLDEDFERALDTIVDACFATPAEQPRAALRGMMRAVGPAQCSRDFHACDAFDVMARLGELALPVLVLGGARDVMTPPKYARYLAERISGARLELIGGAGHLASLEAPDELNARIIRFVDET